MEKISQDFACVKGPPTRAGPKLTRDSESRVRHDALELGVENHQWFLKPWHGGAVEYDILQVPWIAMAACMAQMLSAVACQSYGRLKQSSWVVSLRVHHDTF